MHKIKLKRGQLSNIPRLSLGEPAFTTDSEDLFVGGSSKNIRFVNASKTVTNVYYDSESGNLKKTIDGTDYDAADLHAMAEHDYPGVYSGFVTKDASGDIITIEDGADNVPLKSASFEIKPVQDLHGYDKPWPAGGEKNKCPSYSSDSHTENGITFTKQADGTIKANGTATAVATWREYFTFPAGSYILNGGVSADNFVGLYNEATSSYVYTSGTADSAFTLAQDTRLGVTCRVANGQTVNNIVFKPMIRLSTEADATFAPYSNECPIEGYTGAEINVTGINLFDGTVTHGKFINGNDVEALGADWAHSDYIAVKGGQTYYYAPATVGVNSVLWYDKDKVMLGKGSNGNHLYAMPDNAYYVRLNMLETQVATASFNYPSTDTDYHAYNGQTYSVSWSDEAGTIYKGSAVYKGAGKWNVTNLTGETTITASDVPTEESGYIGTTATSVWIRNFKYSLGGTFATYKSGGFWGKTEVCDVAINNSNLYSTQYRTYFVGITSREALLSAIGEGLNLVYELATPLTFEVDGPDPATLKGLNNIFCSIAPLSITYRVNPADSLKTVAQQDGSYPKLVAGLAKNLIGKSFAEDKEPYLFRKAPKAAMVKDTIVGGTVAFNQLVEITATEPATTNGVTVTNNGDGSITINGTASADTSFRIDQPNWADGNFKTYYAHKYFIAINTENIYYGVMQNSTWATQIVLSADKARIVAPATTREDCFILIRVLSGSSFSNVKIVPQLFDLTQMFGPAIADYIYSLEQATAGAGVAFFRNLFPKPYYDYNAGELMSVKPEAHKMVGFNQWDEKWEVGMIDAYGNNYNYQTDNCIRSKNYIPVIAGATYYGYVGSTPVGNVRFYDSNKIHISGANQGVVNQTFIAPSNASYVRFYVRYESGTIATYHNDICINLFDPALNGTYEPYEEASYPLNSVELRGLFKLDSSNKLYCDGDIYPPRGEVSRKYAVDHIDSSFNFTYSQSDTNAWFLVSLPGSYQDIVPMMASKYFRYVGLGTDTEDSIWIRYGQLHIHPSTTISPSGQTAEGLAEFKAWLETHPFDIVYPLRNPTTETAEPFAEEQVIYSGGTEEYIDERDVAIPVGHESKYYKDITSAIDGIPEAPAEDGTYTLKVVVSSGKASYSWVSA